MTLLYGTFMTFAALALSAVFITATQEQWEVAGTILIWWCITALLVCAAEAVVLLWRAR